MQAVVCDSCAAHLSESIQDSVLEMKNFYTMVNYFVYEVHGFDAQAFHSGVSLSA